MLVAVDGEGRILGLQSLKLAQEGNPYATLPGWEISGTHVRPSSARMGVGSRLFAATLRAAERANLPAIEAYISDQNSVALAYYEAMGFRTWRRPEGAICKRFDVRATT